MNFPVSSEELKYLDLEDGYLCRYWADPTKNLNSDFFKLSKIDLFLCLYFKNVFVIQLFSIKIVF